MDAAPLVVFLVAALIWAAQSIHRIRDGECGVVLRLGRMMPGVKYPGIHFIYWPVDTLYRLSMREQTIELASREYLLDEQRSLQLEVKVTFRIVDALAATSKVADYRYALSSLATTSLEGILRKRAGERYPPSDDALSDELEEALEPSARSWGIEIIRVEVRGS